MHRMGQLGRFPTRIGIVQNHMQSPLRRLNTHPKFTKNCPVSLHLIVPPSKKPEIVRFHNLERLSHFVHNTYQGQLHGRGPNGASEIVSPDKYQNLSPFKVYEIVSTFYLTMIEKKHYRQIEDKAFEDKCRNAMIKFLGDKGSDFHELQRIVRKEGISVAEWEGIFEMGSGHVLLLECKHCVTWVLYSIISNSNIDLEHCH